MDKRERQKEVFVELVNKQLEPFNITYTDVANDPEWYMRYRVTKEQEDNFIKWGVKLIREKLRLTKAMAEKEMSWFILQWGLTTNQVDRVDQVNSEEVKKSSLKQERDKS